MGGRIWVRSEANNGASFYFTLPTTIAPEVTSTLDTGTAFDDTLGQRLPLRILVAEDNAVNRKVVLAMLRRFGYTADVAINGREALDAARRQPYDLVLMDIQMPEMDGLDATRAILALNMPTPPRIVGLSANAMAEDVAAARQAGMKDYLAKPVSPNELRKLLEQSSSP
jgi:CheY-like chemotaxis protein